ncbi:MAG TPA: GGDEF domain-containing protein [Casimicrobiaceae bacterium]|nr:GGDEF domain-containing protein [Casimicrobiaceae bacterium]
MRRLSDLRLRAAFIAAVAALVFVGWVTVQNAAAYVDAVHHMHELTRPDVATDVSSTNGTHSPSDLPATTAADRLVAMRTFEAVAQRRLDAAERAAALLGALAIAFCAAGYALLSSGLRDEKRLKLEINSLSAHDEMTGLPNGRFFTEWLSYAIANARREHGHVGVLFIDINGCAAVDEYHGERATNALLVEVARRFRAASREGDLFARLATTEFALATPNASDGRDLALLAQRLRDQLNEPTLPPLADTPIGASIGIAYFPEDANDSAGIMAAANVAMYAARRAGRNHIAFNALAA